jgi:tRNA-dihydrouridine synthase B
VAILAPLAGITNLPFRKLAKEAGCGLVCSEMISANGLVHRSKKTLNLLQSCPQEKPLSVQIFGSDPAIMADAARIVESSGASIVDINFGCSVKKIVKTGAGVALMRSMKKTEAILTAVRQAVAIPLTIKLRTGWDGSGQQAFAIAETAEKSGVDAVAIHPRTATQGFSGKADWSVIADIKQRVSIPVIGNGDVMTPEDAERMLRSTGCDGVMIGRAAIGAPWIFTQILSFLNGESVVPVGLSERFDLMKRYVGSSIAYFDELAACRMMRSRLGWFVKGLKHSSKFREAIKKISSEAEAYRIIDAYRDALQHAMAKDRSASKSSIGEKQG